jgi:hypothetical protein
MTTDKLDLLTGAKAIAQYLGWSQRKVYHAKKYLPIKSVGAVLIARKCELDDATSTAASKSPEVA